MSAHMAQEKNTRAARLRLGRQIVDVDGKRLGRVDEDRFGADTRNRPRHRRKGETVRQDPVPMPTPIARRAQDMAYPPDATATQYFAPVNSANSSSRRETSPTSSGSQVIAMQAPGAHHFNGGFDRGFGDRLLLGEASCEDGFDHGATFGRVSFRVKIVRQHRPARSPRSPRRDRRSDPAAPRGASAATSRPSGPNVTRTQGTPAAAAVFRSVTVSPIRSDRARSPRTGPRRRNRAQGQAFAPATCRHPINASNSCRQPEPVDQLDRQRLGLVGADSGGRPARAQPLDGRHDAGVKRRMNVDGGVHTPPAEWDTRPRRSGLPI
jgi:hypothetical protein